MIDRRNRLPFQGLLLLAVSGGLGGAWGGSAWGLEHVTLQRAGRTISVDGRVLVTAEDGGLLVQGRDGVLWAVQPDELVEHTTDAAPFVPLTADELARQLLEKLPDGFRVHDTAHYIILHSTSRAYAYWCGSLFERLYRSFHTFWSHKGFALSEPEFPLTAIVFADKRSYVEYARPEAGDAVDAMIGYYSFGSNRMVMYDLTGLEALDTYGGARTSSRIKEFLRRPEAPSTVATIVHEATHQIAFNCGLHQRYSDCPLWFSEGIALYFETPDLDSRRGWRGTGEPNLPRLRQFRRYLSHRPADSLVTLLGDDARLKNTKTSRNAYAEAWALTYFLLERYPRQYVRYLEALSRKEPLIWDDAETRLREFKEAFGDDLVALDEEMVRYIVRLR